MPTMPPEAQALARNPQDLALLAEVANALGSAPLPTRRAELYREILNQDGALQSWVLSGDPCLAIIYGVAFRMVAERRVLQDGQLREWIAADTNAGVDAVVKIVHAMQASRLFCREAERDVLGREQSVIGFRPELIGEFLAARHVRRMYGQHSCRLRRPERRGAMARRVLFRRRRDRFLASPKPLSSRDPDRRGPTRMRITAYAIGTKTGQVDKEIRATYEHTKLAEDLALTPAA